VTDMGTASAGSVSHALSRNRGSATPRTRPAGDQIADGILGAIRDTPLVALRRLVPDAGFDLYGKLEGLNPGGSMKDRSAAAILTAAMEEGRLSPGGLVIESSSGNFAIGLAQASAYLRLRLICVVDTKTTSQHIAVLRTYGADVDMVDEPDPVTGQLLHARLARVRALLDSHAGAFWPNQYANRTGARAHHRMVREIERDLGCLPQYLICATGTCGTLRACSEYVRARGASTTIVAVDALGSAIFGPPAGPRLIPGHGAAIRPALHDDALADRVVLMSDAECVAGCRRLLMREAILAGGSSGAVVSALEHIAPDIEPGSTCVAILADRGERYIDTIYSDRWVMANLGVDIAGNVECRYG
jgi:2,3-diaminopropionate biosynthesis protein SbnA